MITKKQYDKAIKMQDNANHIINEYHRQLRADFTRRMAENPVFVDDELVFSEDRLCVCGHGVAYPAGCGMDHYWECAAVLRGEANVTEEHNGRIYFRQGLIKPETKEKSTRGVFKPQTKIAVTG